MPSRLPDYAAALLGFGMFAVFTGGLALAIGEWPLTIVVAATIIMAAIDGWQALRE